MTSSLLFLKKGSGRGAPTRRRMKMNVNYSFVITILKVSLASCWIVKYMLGPFVFVFVFLSFLCQCLLGKKMKEEFEMSLLTKWHKHLCHSFVSIFVSVFLCICVCISFCICWIVRGVGQFSRRRRRRGWKRRRRRRGSLPARWPNPSVQELLLASGKLWAAKPITDSEF